MQSIAFGQAGVRGVGAVIRGRRERGRAAVTRATVSEKQHFDAIIVLAGGQDAGATSGLPRWVERRLDKSADLLQHAADGCKILCSGGGTPHKAPIIGDNGFCVFESVACCDYLLREHGIPAAQLLKETASYDTIGNAYFAATIHAMPSGWSDLAVVTSEFHMPRSKAIFETVFRLLGDVSGSRFQLSFVSVSDDGLFADDVMQARRTREQESLSRFEDDTKEFHSFMCFHNWLHATHLCYAVARQHEFGLATHVDNKALESY